MAQREAVHARSRIHHHLTPTCISQAVVRAIAVADFHHRAHFFFGLSASSKSNLLPKSADLSSTSYGHFYKTFPFRRFRVSVFRVISSDSNFEKLEPATRTRTNLLLLLPFHRAGFDFLDLSASSELRAQRTVPHRFLREFQNHPPQCPIDALGR